MIETGELPPGVSPWLNAVYVYVEDVDAGYARALKRGAKSLSKPENKPYKERAAGAKELLATLVDLYVCGLTEGENSTCLIF